MPNEPAESDFQHQGQGRRLPDARSAAASSGPTWARARRRRRCPTSKATCSPNAEQSVRATQLQSNWLQILEGDIDTTHVGFLHYGGLKAEDQIPGQLLRVSAARKDRPLRGHRHRGRRSLRRPPTGRPTTRSTGASPSGASRSIRSPRQACWAPRRAATPACRWTTTTRMSFSMVSGRNAARADRPTIRPAADAAQHDRLVRPLPTRARAWPTTSCIDREAQRQNTGSDGYTGHHGHRHAGRGDDRQHGPDLRPLAGAPRHDRRDGHPRPPAPDRRRPGAHDARRHAARRGRSRGVPRPLGRRVPAARCRLGRSRRASCARRSSSTPSWTRRSTDRSDRRCCETRRLSGDPVSAGGLLRRRAGRHLAALRRLP